MDNDALIQITVKRVNNEIEYKVDCSKGVSNEELAHYLESTIEGICKRKPDVCEETTNDVRKNSANKKKVVIQ